MMIHYEEALQKIEEACEALPVDEVFLREAHSQVLAEDVFLPEDLPLFDNSAMDGYALQSKDLQSASEASPDTLTCIGTIGAGDSLDQSVSSGTCLKIMTGAPIPAGADCVVPVEKTRTEGDQVTFKQSSNAGDCIRRKGEEMRAGGLLVEKGTPIDGIVWGLLATANKAKVKVTRRPKVAILMTGNELVEPGEDLRPGEIRNSNGFSMRGVLNELGVEVIDLGVGADDREELQTKLKKGCESDVLITVGGVSAGDFDHIRDLLEEGFLGFEELFYKVRIRPGKPVRCGTMGKTLMFGLPGNPVSCLVGYHLFVKPALKKIWGFRNWRNPVYKTILKGNIKSPAPFLNFWRGELAPDSESGKWVAIPKDKASSSMLTTFLGANGLILVPIDRAEVVDGDSVDFIPV